MAPRWTNRSSPYTNANPSAKPATTRETEELSRAFGSISNANVPSKTPPANPTAMDRKRLDGRNRIAITPPASEASAAGNAIKKTTGTVRSKVHQLPLIAAQTRDRAELFPLAEDW